MSEHPSYVDQPFELHFVERVMENSDSLALLAAKGESRCGVYWIDFEDGYDLSRLSRTPELGR